MPHINKPKRPSRKTRRNISPGKGKKGPGRPGINRKEKTAPRVIANSIFALTLKSKPGLEIVDKTATRKPRAYHTEEDDYVKMYKDLLKSFQNACKICKGLDTWADPFESGLDLGASITYVIKGFEREILPAGLSYNIDRNDQGEYYFTIYQECNFDEYWHAFEIKPIVTKLKRQNVGLHDLFIVFIKSFMIETGINSWYDGGMGYAEYMFEENIENWEDNYGDYDHPEEELQKAKNTLEIYKNGDARKYERLINATKFQSPDKIITQLSRFSGRNKIVKWMLEACLLMKQPCNMDLFIYYENEEQRGEGLRLDQQAAVIWDWDDIYTDLQEECLDSEASSCGVFPPIVNVRVAPKTKTIDFNAFTKAQSWPKELSSLWNKYAQIVLRIKKYK